MFNKNNVGHPQCDQTWQSLQSLGQFFEGLFVTLANFEPTLANFQPTLANFVQSRANCH